MDILTPSERKAVEKVLAFPEDKTGSRSMVVADLFALGCYLIKTGKKVAGRKACLTVLRSADIDPEIRSSILSKACANPSAHFDLLRPHCEILDLFPKPAVSQS